jgi:hypothetical protein
VASPSRLLTNEELNQTLTDVYSEKQAELSELRRQAQERVTRLEPGYKATMAKLEAESRPSGLAKLASLGAFGLTYFVGAIAVISTGKSH